MPPVTDLNEHRELTPQQRAIVRRAKQLLLRELIAEAEKNALTIPYDPEDEAIWMDTAEWLRSHLEGVTDAAVPS